MKIMKRRYLKNSEILDICRITGGNSDRFRVTVREALTRGHLRTHRGTVYVSATLVDADGNDDERVVLDPESGRPYVNVPEYWETMPGRLADD